MTQGERALKGVYVSVVGCPQLSAKHLLSPLLTPPAQQDEGEDREKGGEKMGQNKTDSSPITVVWKTDWIWRI